MGSRLDLNSELKTLLGTSDKHGVETRCFFQPPESLKLSYPCYVYSRDYHDITRADNLIYRRVRRYGLTYITRDPDDPLIEGTEDHFLMCRLINTNAVNGLYHYHYDLYY